MKNLLLIALLAFGSMANAQPDLWDHNKLATTLETEKEWMVKVEPDGDYEMLTLTVKPTNEKDMDGNPVHNLVFSGKDGKPKLILRPDFTKKTGAFVDYRAVDPRIFIIVSPEMLAQVHRPDEDAYYAFLEGSFYTKKGERKQLEILEEYFEKTKIDGTRNTRNVVDIQKRIAEYLEEEYKRETQESNLEKAKGLKSGVYNFYQDFGTKGITVVDKYKLGKEYVEDENGEKVLNGIRMVKADRRGEFSAAAQTKFLEYDKDKDRFVDADNREEKWVIYHGRLMRASKYNTVEGILVHEDKSLGDDYFVLYEKTYGFMKPTKTRYREDVGETHYKGEDDKAYFSYWFNRYVE